MTCFGVFVLAIWLQGGQREDAPKQQEPQQDIASTSNQGLLSEDDRRTERWRKLLKSFGLREAHVFPAAESGPYLGPPLQIWGHGFGTSLWRDPVTGRPIQ